MQTFDPTEGNQMDLVKILELQRAFVKARDWEQFHTPKNLSMALSVEASELLEIFQWLKTDEKISGEKKRQAEEELADVFFFLVRIADVLQVDLEKAFHAKMKKNAAKYPVHLAKGSARKYTELRGKKGTRKKPLKP